MISSLNDGRRGIYQKDISFKKTYLDNNCRCDRPRRDDEDNDVHVVHNKGGHPI